MTKRSLTNKFDRCYIPKDATHYFDFDFYKYAKPPHNRKLLIWINGGWQLSTRTYLEKKYLIENALNDRQIVSLQLPMIKEAIKSEPLEQIAKNLDIEAKKLETILIELGIIQKDEKELATIFG